MNKRERELLHNSWGLLLSIRNGVGDDFDPILSPVAYQAEQLATQIEALLMPKPEEGEGINIQPWEHTFVRDLRPTRVKDVFVGWEAKTEKSHHWSRVLYRKNPNRPNGWEYVGRTWKGRGNNTGLYKVFIRATQGRAIEGTFPNFEAAEQFLLSTGLDLLDD